MQAAAAIVCCAGWVGETMTGLALAGRCWLISPAASGRLPIDLWLRRVLMLTVLLLFPWIVVTVFCRDWKRLVNFFFPGRYGGRTQISLNYKMADAHISAVLTCVDARK